MILEIHELHDTVNVDTAPDGLVQLNVDTMLVWACRHWNIDAQLHKQRGMNVDWYYAL